MKKIVQNVKNGETKLINIPVPTPLKGKVLIKSNRSLVSLGTERMLVDFSKSSYLQKARKQPEKVKMVLDKVKTDGLIPTINTVFNKLNEPMSLGYCNSGVVVEIGDDVKKFKVGDRVISNGAHSEYISVSENLVHKIPDNVNDDDAAFTVIGAIALQGVRLCNPTIGETIVVYGLGLIGLITIQILKANGCKVIGIDLDEEKNNIAKSFGVDTVNPKNISEVEYVIEQTNKIGCDGVIITASAKTNEIIANSAKMSRKRGRIILVGVIGLNISRADFYEKELTFQVSCSYGPGRYDYEYEENGNDYPLPYVRWTENRNFGTILSLIENQSINLEPLITEKKNFLDAKEVYDNINKSKSIATIFVYPENQKIEKKIKVSNKTFSTNINLTSIIGAGGFTSSMIIPSLYKLNYDIKYLSSSNGLNSSRLAKKYKIEYSTTDNNLIFNDKDVKHVFITTRHNTHYDLVMKAMDANKNIFVEKPLCLKKEELKKIIKKHSNSKSKITVGFNRRFAPFSKIVKNFLVNQNTKINIVINVNAGFIPKDSWIQDLKVGGGRIVGEACHFVDLCIFYTSSLVGGVVANSISDQNDGNSDNVSILLKHENGSNSNINYFSNGSKKYSKERIEIFVNGKNVIIDNWRKLSIYDSNKILTKKKNQDKGHYNQFKELKENFSDANRELIPFSEIVNATEATFGILESLNSKSWVNIK